MPLVKFKTYSFKAEDISADLREISGMASTFGNKDLDGDIIEASAFSEQFNGMPLSNVKTLWQHDHHEPIGKGTATLTDAGIMFKTRIAEGIDTAEKAFSLAKQGIIDSFSIGFRIPKGGINFDKARDAWIISKASLHEVSLVTFPANPLASISEVKSKQQVAEVKSSMAGILREAGYSRQIIQAALAGNLANLCKTDGDSEEEAREVINELKRIFNS